METKIIKYLKFQHLPLRGSKRVQENVKLISERKKLNTSCPTSHHRHARPATTVMPDLIGHLSYHDIYGKKGAPMRSLKPEGRKKTTLSGTDPYRNPRRIPSSPEVRTDFHDLARLIARMRFHPNKDGHSDFCLKLHAGCRCAVSFHTMIFYCL